MEMMAVIYATREWRCYLEGQPFTIVTDDQPNTYIDKAANTHTMKRRTRWLHDSGAFNYVWQYKPGKQNMANPISRSPQHFGPLSVLVLPSRQPAGFCGVVVPRSRADRPRKRVRFADEVHGGLRRQRAVAPDGGSDKPRELVPAPPAALDESSNLSEENCVSGSIEDHALVGKFMFAPAEVNHEGDQVLIHIKHSRLAPGLKLKLAPRLLGLFTITKVVGPQSLSYKVALPPPLRRMHAVFHVSSLKTYVTGATRQPPALAQVDAEEANWVVDHISNARRSGARRQYLVHWMDGGESWEDEAIMQAVRNTLDRRWLPRSITVCACWSRDLYWEA